MSKTIVILGAGLAATPLIRQVMRTTVLPSKDLKMIVIAPNTHFYWPIAMPRAVVPGQIPDEKVMYPLEPTFKDYPADKFEFVLGTASTLDPTAQSVTVALNSGEPDRTVPYHTLVIATGTSAKDDMPWKIVRNTEETISKLHRLRNDIERADTIVVAGGGLTGVETAGELGFEYSKHGKKKVYFVYNGALPLSPPVVHSVRKHAKAELQKMNVNLIPNTTVTKVTSSDQDVVLELRNLNGTVETLTAQAYIPTTGVTPNTAFAPPTMLDDGGFIKQTSSLLAEGWTNIFVVGDAGNLETCKAQNAESQTIHLIKALPIYLSGGKLPEYQANTNDIFAITLGRSRATGQMGSLRLFSLLIWYIKGRYLGTDYAGRFAAGKKTTMTTLEK